MKKLKYTKTRGNPLFKQGTSVEVRSNDPGLNGSWYEATILVTPRQRRSRYTVEYKTLFSAPPSSKRSKKENVWSLLKEKVYMSLLRPSSPCKCNRNADFEVFQEVEAYHNDGWWPGVILKKMDDINDDGSYNYSVAFPLSREVFSFRAYDLRKKMAWVADGQEYSWKSNDQLSNHCYDAEEVLYKTTFHVGIQVEVSYDKDNYGACWFVATILQIIGRTYCLVEYDTVRADNNDSSNPSLEEVVDMQYFRPCPPMNMLEPARRFKELDKVEAYYNSGWFLGIVSAILPNSMYVVHISEQNKEVLVPFKRAALRIPLFWEDGQWDEMSQDKDDKVVCRSKGQKFKRSKTRETNSLTDDQLTQPLIKLRKIKDINSDKSPPKSTYPHDQDGNSLVNNTVPSSEKRLKSREVFHDKDGHSLVNYSIRSSKRRLQFREDHYDSPSSVKKTVLSEAKNSYSLNDHLSVASDDCHENAASQIESVTENAKIFEDIIDLDIVEVDHRIQNESFSDKGLSNVIEYESISDKGNGNALNKENVMENGSIFGKGNEFAFSSLMLPNNFESPVSVELVESTKEVLKKFPQNPHFQPLFRYGKVVKEGMICGFVIGFATLVNSIKDLTICSSNLDFEEKSKELSFFEQFGFDTEQVRALLKKLKEKRDKITRSQDKIAFTLSKAEELKKKIACIHEEITKRISETKAIEFEVEQLQSAAMAVEDETVVAKVEFREILKSLK